jgi:hypothetical protein
MIDRTGRTPGGHGGAMEPERRPTSDAVPGAPAAALTEADLLFLLVRERYGSRLGAEELEAIRQLVAGIVEDARLLRAVPLGNADAPLLPTPPPDA